jgi:hypothetical protein
MHIVAAAAALQDVVAGIAREAVVAAAARRFNGA